MLTIINVQNKLLTFGFHCIYTFFPLVQYMPLYIVRYICMLFEAGNGIYLNLKKKLLGWRMPSGPEGRPSGVIPPPRVHAPPAIPG